MKRLIITFALLFGIKANAQTFDNAKLNQFIKEWIGVPYKFGGNTKFGIDCSNFVEHLYKEAFDISISGTCYKLWNKTNRVVMDSLQLGDLVFFNSPLSPSGWHVGVYLSDTQFIHAANKASGVKISSLNELFYKKHYKGAGRF